MKCGNLSFYSLFDKPRNTPFRKALSVLLFDDGPKAVPAASFHDSVVKKATERDLLFVYKVFQSSEMILVRVTDDGAFQDKRLLEPIKTPPQETIEVVPLPCSH
jgi:hypothetical protein